MGIDQRIAIEAVQVGGARLARKYDRIVVAAVGKIAVDPEDAAPAVFFHRAGRDVGGDQILMAVHQHIRYPPIMAFRIAGGAGIRHRPHPESVLASGQRRFEQRRFTGREIRIIQRAFIAVSILRGKTERGITEMRFAGRRRHQHHLQFSGFPGVAATPTCTQQRRRHNQHGKICRYRIHNPPPAQRSPYLICDGKGGGQTFRKCARNAEAASSIRQAWPNG